MEDKKIPLRVVIITIIILAAVGVWCFFSDILSGGHGSTGNVDTDIKRLGEQQQKAADAIERAESRLGNSIKRIDNIEESINRAESSGTVIEDRTNHSKERIVECERIINDSQQRIEEYRRRLQSSPTKK